MGGRANVVGPKEWPKPDFLITWGCESKRPPRHAENGPHKQNRAKRHPTYLGNEKSAQSFPDRSFFVDVHVGCPCQNASFFPGLGGFDRSFRPDVRRDIRPKTSSLGWFFIPEYDSNRNVYQTNSPEFEVGNSKNYRHPKNPSIFSRSFWRETWQASHCFQ